MKKIIIAIAALLISSSAFAQFGIMAGVTSSQTDIKSAVNDYKNITLYHVGVAYKFGVGNIFAIQPALVYNVKGTKMEDLGSSKLEAEFKTGYLELPVSLQAGIGLGPIIRIFGLAEPFLGYAITNDVKAGDTTKQSWDYISSRFEYGVGLGAGVELFQHLQVAVKYFWNLGNVYDFNIATASDALKGKCNGVTASVMFLF